MDASALLWSALKYAFVVLITIISTSYVTGREVGKHLSEIDDLKDWRTRHEIEFKEIQAVVNYLRGRLNGHGG